MATTKKTAKTKAKSAPAKKPVKKAPVKPAPKAAKPAPKKVIAKPAPAKTKKTVVAKKPATPVKAKPPVKKIPAKPAPAKKPIAAKVVAKKPVPVKVVPKKPEIKKPVAHKPAPQKPITKKPEPKKTEKEKKPMTITVEKKKSVETMEKYDSGIQIDHVEIPKVLKAEKPENAAKFAIETKLIALYSLQQIDSQIDKIKTIRGELPLEVQDLEDGVAQLETRIENYNQEITNLEKEIAGKQITTKEANALIKKYKDQKNNVRNNREYDSLTKEIEFQTLEIQLCEKKTGEFKATLEVRNESIKKLNNELKELKIDLDLKRKELNDISSETEKEEMELQKKSNENKKYIEDRLLNAYLRIRENAKNGLAVVKIERDACGGCFNKIPPQRQLEIQMHKKIIVCEYCGRIIVDDEIVSIVTVK